MGAVYRKTVTKPIPPDAEISERQGKRYARWRDCKGKARSAPLTKGNGGADRIIIKARTYTAKYRDGSGIVREVATGCRDEAAARSILGDLERRAELVKGNVLSADEDAMIDYQSVPVVEHLAAYMVHLQAKGDSEVHLGDTRRLASRVITDCRFVDLGDISHDTMERWLVQKTAEGMGSRTRNSYLQAIRGFCNWCIQTNRMVVNPLRRIAKADERVDRRRNRRALTEDELVRLLDAAVRRPLAERGRLTVHKPKEQVKRHRDTWKVMPLGLENLDAATQRARERLARSPDEIVRLEALGRERALIYKTLVLTGLRQGELASLTTGQLVLDATPPFLILHAADEKNREGSTIPLRPDLGADLRAWVAQKGVVAANTPLFAVPSGLVRILEYDLRLAGIPKVDERGRSVDVHALRHTFGTLLSKAGVAPRTAQAAMRHSKIDLTMNVYTDPKLLDVAGAIEALPALPLGAIGQKPDVKANGSDISHHSQFAPAFAPTAFKSSTLQSFSDKKASDTREEPGAGGIAV
ncbi:MAG: tyrosine-type recombinase/integrase, partial [Thermoguttaceae bacterium]